MPTVNLESSRRSRPFTVDKERLWARDLEDLVELIQNHVKALDEHLRTRKGTEKEKLEGAPNLAIAVFGPAGSGKSSLLKTLVYECQKEKDEKSDAYKGVASLDVLQPARFSEHDNLLFATVAAALDAHRKNEGERTFEYERTTAVLNAYRDLDEHLRVVLKEEMPKDLDPHALAAEYIQRHTSALNLKAKIDDFLEKLADNLNGRSKASVVLLPVDDLDLNHSHLHLGLRHLQAYLLHPRIVPVFCFTDRLAEEILTGHFAGSLKEADNTRQRGERLAVSEQLAVQHLAKCFPVRNRIRLGPVPATLQGAMLRTSPSSDKTRCECCGQEIKSCECEDPGRTNREKEEGSQPVIQTLVAASYLLFGVPDRDARHPVRAALRPSTLRRQFHVIDAMRQAQVAELIDTWMDHFLLRKHSVRSSREGKKRCDDSKHCAEIFDDATWGLMNVHRDVLREFGLHLEDLLSWTPHALRRVILQALFRLPSEKQIALWQRWQSLTDSRRSQVISLLATNIHRPWVENERPSGESYIQIALWEDEESAVVQPMKIPATMALLWLIEILVGFYLPVSRSVDRTSRDGRKRGGKPAPLSPSGWTLYSAPVQAALSADDDETLLPTGMMFLDPLSYATALTTAPRIAACRVLDEINSAEVPEGLIKEVKVAYLSRSTREILQIDGKAEKKSEPKSGSRAKYREDDLLERSFFWDLLGKDRIEDLPDSLSVALNLSLKAFVEISGWEAGGSVYGPKKLKIDFQAYGGGEGSLARNIKHRQYDEALRAAKDQASREVIQRLKAAAEAVHDDQLLLRLWTCYGYNQGRFWAAVSFWRGLGLMGQLMESHRRWYQKLTSRQKDDKEQGTREIRLEIEKRIGGALRSHSLRGLVPGKDLGGRSRRGLIGLAFSGWDSKGQRDAIGRLAKRLESWLWHNRDRLTVPIFQGRGDKPRWSTCFVRRLHGGYVVGSLWQWLDAENLEYQGRQYGKRKSYYWNAGVALTSWHRVLLRYLGGSLELRWLLESCPLTAPFLSQGPAGIYLEKLREKPYHELLRVVAEDAIIEAEKRPVSIRNADQFRELATILEEAWLEKSDLGKLVKIPDAKKGDSLSREFLEEKARILARTLIPENIVRPRRATEWLNYLYSSAGIEKSARSRSKNDSDLYRLYDWASRMQHEVGLGSATKITECRKSIEGAVATVRSEEDGNVDKRVACFELASVVQQYWKLMAHASATSLFYQTPRVHRDDFFRKEDHDPKDRKCCGEGEAET